MISSDSINRRDFLRNGASLVALGATVPSFLAESVYASAKRKSRSDERILVVLQLAGGNDGLNTIVPVTNDDYYRARPKLAIAKDKTLRINDDLGFADSAKGFKDLFDAGYMSLIQNVGYPNPNRSHFHSMDIWHTASPDGRQHEGWLGRYCDNQCAGAGGCDAERGIALMPQTPLAMRGKRFMPLSFESPDDLSWQSAVPGRDTGEVVRELNQPQPGDPPQPQSELHYLRRVALKARISSEQIHQATRGRTGSAGSRRPRRGGRLSQSLQTVADLIAAGIKAKVYYVSHGGYDTHANQANSHGRLLTELSSALSQFVQRLKSQRDLDRVMIMSFSEFGRRVAENGSGGTDHGAAAPMMLVGSQVKAGVVGSNPDLKNLDAGDLRYGVDFRDVYAEVLRRWLSTSPENLINRKSGALNLIKRR